MAPSNLKLQDSQDLFQIDSTGSQSVRQRLQTDARPHPRKGSAKPLKSAQIIAEARGGSSKTKPFVAKHARQREKEAVGYNRDLHAKLQRMVKRKAKSGQGLWGVAQQEGETDAGVVGQQTYDVWSAAAPQEPSSSKGRIFKMPKTLHQHHLLTEGNTPSAINLPHPGQSYNPTATAHSSLIDRAYQSAALEEEQVKKAQALKDRFEGIRKDRKEAWQLAEEDVGSGDEAVEESALDELPAKKVSKRKTDKERRKRIDNIRSEVLAFPTTFKTLLTSSAETSSLRPQTSQIPTTRSFISTYPRHFPLANSSSPLSSPSIQTTRPSTQIRIIRFRISLPW